MKRIASAVILCLIATAVSATENLSDRMKPFDEISFEDSSCGTWAESVNNHAQRSEFEFWVRGVATGINYADRDNQISLDSFPNQATLALYIDKYCRDHPLQSVGTAAFSLMDELRATGSTSKHSH